MFVDLSKRFQVKPGALYTESAYMEEARRSGEEYEQRVGRKILGVDHVHAGVRWPEELY